MTVLESAFERVSDDIEAGRAKHYEYNLKIDIVLEDGIETVHGKVLLIKTLGVIKTATRGDEVIEFYDVEGTQVNADLKGIKSHDISKRFCVESTGGKTKVLLFGIRIQSTIPFSVIKDRIIPELKPLRTYMKIHHAGFEHGVNWSQLGFFLNTHPSFNDKTALLANEVTKKLEDGWYHDTKFWTAEKKHEIKTLFDSPNNIFRPTDIPFAMVPANANSKTSDDTINVSTTMLVIPNKYLRAGIQLMDYLILEAKSTTAYVPLGLKQTDKQVYHTILKAHSKWMDNHRNIQITFTAPYFDVVSVPGEKDGGKSILQIIQSIPDIIGYHLDTERSRINVSVDHLKFRSTQQLIQQEIEAQDFPFNMQVKMPRNAATDNSTTTASTVTMQSKYLYALSSIITTASNATCDETTTLQSTKSAWKRRTSVPIVIDYNNDLEQFPPLTTPKATATTRTINTNPSQANENASDTLTITTVNNAVAEALATAREEHRREREEHRSDIETLRIELRDLKVSFQSLVQTIANQSETIIHHIQSNKGPEMTEPSPPRKRRDNSNNKTPTRHNTSTYAEDTIMSDSSSSNTERRPKGPHFAQPRRRDRKSRGHGNAPEARKSTRYRRDDEDDDDDDDDDYSSGTSKRSQTRNIDESIGHFDAIIARAHDSEDEIIFQQSDQPEAIKTGPNETMDTTVGPANPTTLTASANNSPDDSFYEMMSDHSNAAEEERYVPSTQEDTKMSSGRED
jgi:hypothetical protein